MKKIIATLVVLISLSLISVAQPSQRAKDNPVRRIKIQHADPALIIMLLSGQNPQQPEYSTLWIGGGFSSGFGGGSGIPGSGFGGGSSGGPGFGGK